MRSLSAETKLVTAVLALSVLAGAAGAELVADHFEEKVEEVGAHVLHTAAETFALQQRAEVEKLTAALDVILTSTKLREAFEARDRERLLALAAPVLARLREHSRITHWYFHSGDEAPQVFLRVHRPALFGDTPQRATLRRAKDSKEVGAGLELGQTAFALRVVQPWIHAGRVIGYVELAEDIDHFLTSMKGRTGDEYGLMVRKKYLDESAWAAAVGPKATSWDAAADTLLVDATSGADGILDWKGDVESLPPSGLTLGERERDDRAFIRGVFPVSDAAGRRVGALFVIHDFTAHHQAVRDGHGYALAVMIACAVAAAGGVALLVHLLVFRRLQRLRLRLERRASRLTPAGRPVEMESPDDLGRIEALFDRAFLDHGAPDQPGEAKPGPG